MFLFVKLSDGSFDRYEDCEAKQTSEWGQLSIKDKNGNLVATYTADSWRMWRKTELGTTYSTKIIKI